VKNVLLRLNVKRQVLCSALKQEAGQDLVEYAAIITVIVLGLIVGMGTLANGINNAMSTVSGRVNTAMQSAT
jgi:Flp pilus assembly pilin Flp